MRVQCIVRRFNNTTQKIQNVKIANLSTIWYHLRINCLPRLIDTYRLVGLASIPITHGSIYFLNISLQAIFPFIQFIHTIDEGEAMIELFISDDKQLLESIGREFAYIMGKHLEGPFITKYQGVFPVDQLTPCKYDYSYNKYVDLANMEECKYGIQIRNELLCGM